MLKILSLLLTLLSLLTPLALADEPAVFLAGAAEAEITPEVARYEDKNNNGRFDFGDPSKAFGFGDRVLEFSDGKIFVGNGTGEALYIYDKLYVYALVIEDQKTHKTIALVSSDIYLLTAPDVDKIRQMVDPKYGIDLVVISATHNHMGPDTLGLMGVGAMPIPKMINAALKTGKLDSGVNPGWFEKYRTAVVQSIEKAAKSKRPAHIRFAQTDFNMGLIDMREPLLPDPTARIMAVDGTDGKPIATLLQWTNHPETVLEYGRPDRTDYDQLPYEVLTDEQKEAWGKVITAGFPGYTRETLRKLRGGIPMYFNGAVGGMQTTLRAPLWDPEKHPEYPSTTDSAKVPKDIWIPNDFRFAPILGRELAKASVKALETSGTTAEIADVSFVKKDVLLPMDNNLFRAMASFKALGYEHGMLYDDQGNPDRSFGSWIGGVFLPGVQVAKGRNVKTEISVINIGPAQFINVPGEPLPEVINGFPDDFYSNLDKYFPENRKFHEDGSGYVLSAPPLKDSVTGDYLFIFGLAGGEVGYIIPKVDFDPPHDLKIPPFVWWWWICMDAEDDPHYEESNSLTPMLEPILLNEFHDLLKQNPVSKKR